MFAYSLVSFSGNDSEIITQLLNTHLTEAHL